MIPLADAPTFRGRARATLAVRAALLLVALGSTIAFVLVARQPRSHTAVALPSNASTVLVLDLSASISSDTFSRIGATLAALSRSSRRVGLVVFSDVAYEALPPGVPATALAPLVRYFTLPTQSQPAFAPAFPVNPWTSTFSSGTRISTGLELAHTIALAQSRRPAVVLISDLDDDPDDLPRLAGVLAAYRRDRLPVRVIGLDPTPQDVVLFRRLIGPAASITRAPTPNEVPPRPVTPFPWLLVSLAAASAAALALLEGWSPRLDWRTA